MRALPSRDATEDDEVRGTRAGSWRPGVLQQFDSDGDGQLDESELSRMIQTIEARCSRLSAQLTAPSQLSIRPVSM